VSFEEAFDAAFCWIALSDSERKVTRMLRGSLDTLPFAELEDNGRFFDGQKRRNFGPVPGFEFVRPQYLLPD
jgi:hypothetical protein